MGKMVVCLGAIIEDRYYKVAKKKLDQFLITWGSGLEPGGEEDIGQNSDAETYLIDLLSHYATFKGRYCGGQAGNTAMGLACMGKDVALVGRVGTDEEGDFLRKSLYGVDLRFLRNSGISGRAYILIDPTGERTILAAPKTNNDLCDDDIPWEFLSSVSFLHMTSFGGIGPLIIQGKIAQRLNNGPKISLDPGELYARRGRKALADLLNNIEIFLPNEREWTYHLGGEINYHPHWAPSIVIVKRGAMGASLLTPTEIANFPARKALVENTVGAGDIFAAGYLAGLAEGMDLPMAVRLAVEAATYKVSKAGSKAYPDKNFLEQFKTQNYR